SKRIGGYYNGGFGFKGFIAEMIIYDTSLGLQDFNTVEQYLHYKYAPPISLGPDIHIPYGFCDTLTHAGERFTSYLWSTAETTDTIMISKSGVFSVTVTDIFGFTSTDEINVYYNDINQPIDTAICLYDTLYWNTGLTGDYMFFWTGDTVPADAVLPIYETGQYFGIIRDNEDCEYHTDTITVFVDPFEDIMSLGNDDTVLCAGNTLFLEDGYESGNSYLWSDGSTGEAYLVNVAGEVSVTVTNINNCTGFDTINISEISGTAPVPGFSYSGICFGEYTQFTDSSYANDSSNIVWWEWAFGDGNLETIQNPGNQYQAAGEYPVTLIVKTDSECSNTLKKFIEIHPLPVADFSPVKGCSNTALSFTDLSHVLGEQISSWYWDFDDGDTDSISEPLHQYSEQGVYHIYLQAISEYGCMSDTVKDMEIRPGAEVDFSYGSACKGQTVSFYDLSEPFINQTVTWYWTFGNGNSSHDQNPLYTYNSTGDFNVTLFVTQPANGCISLLSKTVHVANLPVAAFNTDEACLNKPYQFTDMSYCADTAITLWRWSLGDSIISNQANPAIIFNDTGDYSVQLTAVSSYGCSNSITQNIHVNPLPDAAFTFTPNFGNPPLMVYFTNLSSGASQFLWNFGDEQAGEAENPIHLFQDIGQYNICMTAISGKGCRDSSYGSVKVLNVIADLVIYEVRTTTDNDYMTVWVDFINSSTFAIDSVQLELQVEGNASIRETWYGRLQPGSAATYKFIATYRITPNNQPAYICVEGQILGGYTDSNPVDNRKCVIFENTFVVFEPYPNPANDKIYIEFIIPTKENVEVQIFNSAGQNVGIYTIENPDIGLNRYILETQTLRNGVYNYTLYYNELKETRRFFKE
ncbi:MAG: PKD domain-containing protein, partial [Bacteroidia bacterium]|nr:PKD domain-containing protein [Bacteroidia bacterium]